VVELEVPLAHLHVDMVVLEKEVQLYLGCLIVWEHPHSSVVAVEVLEVVRLKIL
tara:strand:+ start:215 stop:376 length:162 start_codon:yes stop_codon:yes gene_type:complete